MAQVRVMILRAAGTNCDRETMVAWALAGATPERVHVRRLIERPALLDEYQIVTIPGGFSFGDDISAGRIFAALIERHLCAALAAFVERGGLVLGICNGFQVLVKAGLLPAASGGDDLCTLAGNRPTGFQDRWIRLRAPRTPCAFVEPEREYELPIAHGEGRVVLSGRDALDRLERGGQVALYYVAGPPPAAAPANPNGSDGDIAGLCDASGRVFGLMPHPERFVFGTQHPSWTSRPPREHGDGLAFFTRAVARF